MRVLLSFEKKYRVYGQAMAAAIQQFRPDVEVAVCDGEDLEVAWQAGTITDTRDVHLDGIDVALVDPLLPDGDGLKLIREVSVANPKALALVLSHKLDEALYQQALGAGAVEVLATNTGLEEVIDAVRRRSADAS